MQLFSKKNKVDLPCIIGKDGEYKGKSFVLPEKLRLGRHKDNDVVFKSNTVSGFHAEIQKLDENFEIVDLGSKNRTRVNGRKIFKPIVLSENDTIKIGDISFIFHAPSSKTTVISPKTIAHDSVSAKKNVQLTEQIQHTQKIERKEEVLHTQKISNYNFKPAPSTCPDAQPNSDSSDSAKPLKNDKKNIARKIIIYSICFLLAISLLILLMISPDSKTEPKSKNEQVSMWSWESRLPSINKIWEAYQQDTKQNNPDLEKAITLRNEAEAYYNNISTNPRDALVAYKKCLEAISYIDDDSEMIICSELLLALKLTIENLEKEYNDRAYAALNRKDWKDALVSIKNITQLLNLDNENSESSLAKWYYKKDYQIGKAIEKYNQN